MRLTRRMSNATPPMIGLWAMCVICWASGTTTASEVEAQTLEVAPVKFVLSGSTSSQKLLVTANAGLKSVFDATDAAAMQTENPDIAIVKNGVVNFATNMAPEWFGTDASAVFAKRLGLC